MLEFGPTQYNVILVERIDSEFYENATGRTLCFKARVDDRMVGVATGNTHRRFPEYERTERLTGYLSQNVVAPAFRGCGIGSALIVAHKAALLRVGVCAI